MLLIAGGVGITPLRALFETLPAAPGDLTLIYRASSMRDVVFRERARAARRAPRRAGLVRRGQPRRARTGTRCPRGELTRRVPGLIDHDVYLCGPPGLTAAVTRELLDAGVRRRHIHHESFEF